MLRMLQPPELARAMGFGEDLILEKGPRRDKIMILGNGVCPPVIATVVSALIQHDRIEALKSACSTELPVAPYTQVPTTGISSQRVV